MALLRQPSARLPALSRRWLPLRRGFQYSAEQYRALRHVDPLEFWLQEAKSGIDWFTPPHSPLDASRAPFYSWFPGGSLNTCYNALDRHLPERGAQTAIAYVSAVGGRSRDISYARLHHDVSRLAGAFAQLGVRAGDRVLLYMPMVPEAATAMLACARLGAVHSVVFGGFASGELAVRLADAAPTLVVASSCGLERGKVVPYWPMLREALRRASLAPAVMIHQRHEAPEARVPLAAVPRGSDFDEAIARAPPHDCVPLPASAPLYTLYTSGTTGRPKGILRDNTHAVPLQWSMRHFMRVGAGETYWSASDIGWVVGHSYIVYGPLLAGCTSVLYEGKPVGTPDAAAYWRVVEQRRVHAMFTAPTALRAIRSADPAAEGIRRHDLRSLRALFVAGERADPHTVNHFRRALGVPIVDNWWQTETGWPIAGIQLDEVGGKPGSTSLPLPGYDVRVLDETGAEAARGKLGSLAIRLPLPPGTMRTLYNSDARCRESYFDRFPGFYCAGDAGVLDEDGYIHVMERTDDVINCAGHRLSTGALEEVVAAHRSVAECAVVGVEDELKGQIPVCLVVLTAGCQTPAAQIAEELVAMVREEIGPVAAFKHAAAVAALPKTRSGKILRGLIQSIADGKPYRIPGTIEDEAPIDAVKSGLRSLGYPRLSDVEGA
ncbi:hypothetical protein AB1Y20_012008 [Prymnesium parvum]|uniref:Propionate--CoA ligase n=1 Tax=Prymnesium parvum TaxID=97485 RepID=A0AB34IQW5_PRYPA